MKYYKSCDTLLLWNFFKILETGNFKYLAITDDYDNIKIKQDLTDIWEEIIKEYSDISENKMILDRFENFKKLTQLLATYRIVTAMIYTLYFRYNREYIEDLAFFGYHVEIKNNVIQVRSLRRCEQMSKAILNEVDEILHELKESKDDKKTKNTYYTKVIPQLSSYYGDLNEKQLTVSKYVGLLKAIRQSNGRNQRTGRI